jgi:uncharacterized membrane protein
MKKKKGRRGVFLLALAVVLFCAVALWFFWPEISWRMGWDGKKPSPARSTGPAKERLSEEDRRNLDRLLKERQSK